MLTQKTVIVTGSSKGIGRNIARLFATQGAVVYAIGRQKDELSSLVEESKDLQGTIREVVLDIRDMEKVKEVWKGIYKEEGKIDILVNNAGIMKDALLGMITGEMMDEIFSINVFSLIQLTQLTARFMTRKKSGSIINMASIIGTNGNAGQSVYAASKGAVISFTKSAAKELAPSGIRVNAIAPGIVDTDLLKEVPEEQLKRRTQQIKMGRIATPEDIVGTALYLASDLSNYVTGQIISVDGATIL